MSILLLQRPSNSLVEGLDGLLALLGDVSKNGMYHLALVEPFLALYDILRGNTTLGKIDVTLEFVVRNFLGSC